MVRVGSAHTSLCCILGMTVQAWAITDHFWEAMGFPITPTMARTHSLSPFPSLALLFTWVHSPPLFLSLSPTPSLPISLFFCDWLYWGLFKPNDVMQEESNAKTWDDKSKMNVWRYPGSLKVMLPFLLQLFWDISLPNQLHGVFQYVRKKWDNDHKHILLCWEYSKYLINVSYFYVQNERFFKLAFLRWPHEKKQFSRDSLRYQGFLFSKRS